jgi:hypothetical protein
MANWTDDFWLGMAWKYAIEGSKDPSTKVGCVIVRPDDALLVGHQRLPAGDRRHEERLADRPTKLELTVHAEINAFLFAPERVVRLHHVYDVRAVHPVRRCTSFRQDRESRTRPSDNPRWRDEQGVPSLCSARQGSRSLSTRRGNRPSNWQPSVQRNIIDYRELNNRETD